MIGTGVAFKGVVDDLRDGVYFVDLERRITYWNRGAERITGYTASDVLGCRCFDGILTHVDEAGTRLCRIGCPLAATALDGRPREADLFLHHKEGHRVPVRVRAAPIRDDGGAIVGAFEVFSHRSSDAAALHEIEELRRLALLDDLTELANRRYLKMLIRSKLGELERYGWPLGVLFVDVDRFKTINDTHGHAAGDRALRMVAKTLSSAARTFDIVGRWGGEEFVILLVNVSVTDLPVIAERVRMLVESSSVAIAGDPLRVTVSVGATLAAPKDTVDTLVDRADRLMYKSKTRGRNRVTTDVSTGG